MNADRTGVMSQSLSFKQLRDLTHGRVGVSDSPCPLCGPDRRSAVNQRRQTLRLWCDDPGRITYHCARCEQHGWAVSGENSPASAPPRDLEKIRAEVALRDASHQQTRRVKALSLWRRRIAPVSTPVNVYLRQARGYGGKIPATIGYLPASRGFPPAMITAIGFARETEPGELVLDDSSIAGIHLTSLAADGRGKAGTDRDKTMIGRSVGSPIVLALLNDLLGLAIAEGIEDALSIHEATGLGAWAAGSASRMPALADVIPSYVDCVTIVADADETGRQNAEKLMAALAGRHDVRLIVPSHNRRAV